MQDQLKMQPTLLATTLRKHHLSEEKIKFCEKHFKPTLLTPGDVLVKEGDVWGTLLVVESGVLRFYYTLDNGDEVNNYFLLPGECIAPVWSAVEHKPSDFGIVALKRTRAYVIPIEKLINAPPEKGLGHDFVKSILEEVLATKITREKSLLIYDASHRYQEVIKTMSNYIQNIPQFHIASYIGINAVTLSRVKNKRR